MRAAVGVKAVGISSWRGWWWWCWGHRRRLMTNKGALMWAARGRALDGFTYGRIVRVTSHFGAIILAQRAGRIRVSGGVRLETGTKVRGRDGAGPNTGGPRADRAGDIWRRSSRVEWNKFVIDWMWGGHGERRLQLPGCPGASVLSRAALRGRDAGECSGVSKGKARFGFCWDSGVC